VTCRPATAYLEFVQAVEGHRGRCQQKLPAAVAAGRYRAKWRKLPRNVAC